LAFVAVIGLLAAALTAPPVAALLVWQRDHVAGASIDEGESVYALASSARSVTVGATATAEWRDLVVVRAPPWEGLVTEVLATVGASLDSGAPVARVNGVEVRHFVLPSPLYQPVCVDATASVGEVREVLAQAGFAVGAGQKFSRADVAAVRKYAAAIGAPNANEAECFDPAWVTVSPEPLAVIGRIELTVGAPAPPLGEVVLSAQPVLSALVLTADGGGALLDGALAEGTAFAAAELVIGGEATGVGPADLASPEVLTALSERFDPESESPETSVSVRLELEPTQFVVPATAVVNPLSEEPCVVNAGGRAQTTPVTVLASAVSGLVVDVAADAITSIRVAPGIDRCE
jgi:hypothetical protein